jgi:hypothetical protein
MPATTVKHQKGWPKLMHHIT